MTIFPFSSASLPTRFPPVRPMRFTFGLPCIGVPVASLLGIVALNVHSQEAAAVSRSLSVVPSLSVSQTFTDNRGLVSDNRQAELITQVSPGLHINSTSGRIRGHLDYALSGYLYARDSGANNFQQSLNAALKAEVIPNWGFVDVAATISQQNISAFGTQTSDPALRTSNQSEVSSYSIFPYVRGEVPGVLNYQVRTNYALTRGGSYAAANSTAYGGMASISSDRSLARVGWFADASRQVSSFDQGRQTESDLVRGGLNLNVTPELMLSANGGREANNYQTLDKAGHNTWGWGVNWRPNQRTHLSFNRDHRFFGQAHSAVFEYRTPRTAWSYIDSRQITTGTPTDGRFSVTVHDVLFAQLASSFPDPVVREQQVAAFLLANSLTSQTSVVGGFLTAAVSLQRRQELALALTGLRTTVIVSAFQTQTSRLDPLARGVDELSGGGTIQQRGGVLNVSHRLTPGSTLNLGFSQLKSSTNVGSQASNQRTVTATWASQISSRTSLSLSARHVIFGSPTIPYNESALIAGLIFRF